MPVTAYVPARKTSHKQSAIKRTNSLGFSKTDCHRCSSLRRHCDRRRPRCSACLADGIICSGYVQQLDWERGNSRKGKAARKEALKKPDLSKSSDAISQLPQPAAFTFVDQSKTPGRPRKRSIDVSDSGKSHTPNTPDMIELGRRDSTSTTYDRSPQRSTSPWTVSRTSTPPTGSEIDQFAFSIPAKIYRHSGDLEDSLSFFHDCFSYTTLTFPVHINPWQAAIPQIHDDAVPCVRYAAVALAQRQQAHLNGRPENLSVLRLKDRALSIFATHLNDVSLESGISTALLLFALDYVESGYSNWVVHLRGAYKILELHGGIGLAQTRPNLRSQIAMLLWYDVTAAMVSRCGPVFPRAYLEVLMEWQSDGEWSMLALNGLPDDMFLDMYDMTAAAVHPHMLTSSEIMAMEAKISNICIEAHGNDLFYAMSEAWKLCLLLYCSRVFPPVPEGRLSRAPQDEASSRGLSHEANASSKIWPDSHDLAVEILGHVESLPPHSSLQKQCLMPLMLAGCEIRPDEPELIRVVVDYGERWKHKTGIWVWNSGSEFLSSVWAVSEQAIAAGRPPVSWTEVFPPSSQHGFLFG